MGSFDLRKESSSREAEFIVGIPKKKLEVLALNVPGLVINPYGIRLKLRNHLLAKYIAEHAYRGEAPVPGFGEMRRFRPEHYSLWSAWNSAQELHSDSFNFPLAVETCPHTDFTTLITVQEEVSEELGIPKPRIGRELQPILEERIYGTTLFRFCCDGNTTRYHREDMNQVVAELYAAKRRSIEERSAVNPGTKHLQGGSEPQLPGWYSYNDMYHLLFQQGERLPYSRVKRLLEIAAERGIPIKVRDGQREPIFYITPDNLAELVQYNKDYDPKAKRKKMGNFLKRGRRNYGPRDRY